MSIFNEMFNGFDPSTLPPTEFDLLPPGKYAVVVDSAEVKTTQSGDGNYLAVQSSVVEGEHVNRKLWTNYNFRNRNPQTQAMAQRDLAKLWEACGLNIGLAGQNDEKLIVGRKYIAGVQVKRDKRSGEDKNEIRAWLPYGPQSMQTPPAAAPTPAPTQAPAADQGGGDKTPPWLKK